MRSPGCRYVSHIGPQDVFPVYPGILNTKGDNTIGIAVWGQRPTGESEVKFSRLYVADSKPSCKG